MTALADEQLHRRLAHDAGVLALQPVIEKAQLVAPAFLGIERVVVRAGVNAQLLPFRRGAQVAFGVAAQMQPHAAPVAGAE